MSILYSTFMLYSSGSANMGEFTSTPQIPHVTENKRKHLKTNQNTPYYHINHKTI